MQRSTDRILTTHVGALQRPPELSKALTERGEWAPDVLPELRAAVAEVVARQERAGIDVVDDGEFGKTLWMWYVRDRMDGIEGAGMVPGRRAAPQGPRPRSVPRLLRLG